MKLSFENAVTVFRALEQLYKNKNDESDYIAGIIFGNQESLTDVLETYDKEIIQNLNAIYNAVQESNMLAEWKGVANSLAYVHSVLAQYHSDLSSVYDKTTSKFTGTIVAGATGETVSFSDWCLGYTDAGGTVHASALSRLSALVSPETITANDLDVSSLCGIFSTDTPGGSASTLGLDAISTWKSMILLAKQDANVTNLPASFQNETQYESVLRLMNYTYSLVSMTLYLHDSALQLLISSTGSSSGYDSVLNSIQNNFGSYNQQGSVWELFAETLDTLASGTPDAQASLNQAAYVATPQETNYSQVNDYKPEYVSPYSLVPVNKYVWGYCSTPYSIKGWTAKPNAFFGSLGFLNINPKGSPYAGDVVYLAVQGTVVTIEPGLELNTLELFPTIDDFTSPALWYGTTFSQGFSGIGTYEGTYVEAPQHSNPNHLNVITGFQLVEINNGSGGFNLALALQFGVLDVTDPNNPIVNIVNPEFIAPKYTQALAFQEYACVNQSGNCDSSGTIQPSILSNATICRLTNGVNGINVQAAPEIFMADFLQPALLQSPLQNQNSTVPTAANA
ncbi:MAG: hypothetical protein L6Q81_05090 [Bacteroidia bacterium]|nr:hypothetical protein [Bacteroidia bacterium]